MIISKMNIVPPVITEQGRQRMEICNRCKYITYVKEEPVCTLCGCMLIYKTNDKDQKCPSGYW
jgi:uncharacterized paraquat-inducible protein A